MKTKKIIILGILLILTLVLFVLFKDLRPVINKKTTNVIKGIDISHHNKITNFPSSKNNIQFCIIKSTEGSSVKDRKFKTNWDLSKQKGLVRGAYHFFSPGVSGEKQFENFKNNVKLSSGDLPPIVDVEVKECDMDEINKFLKLAEKNYGVKPIIYSEYLFFKIFIESKLNSEYPIWICINEKLNVKPQFNNYDCVLWQYSKTGKVKGIVGDVDLDYFMGNEDKFNSLRID